MIFVSSVNSQSHQVIASATLVCVVASWQVGGCSMLCLPPEISALNSRKLLRIPTFVCLQLERRVRDTTASGQPLYGHLAVAHTSVCTVGLLLIADATSFSTLWIPCFGLWMACTVQYFRACPKSEGVHLRCSTPGVVVLVIA